MIERQAAERGALSLVKTTTSHWPGGAVGTINSGGMCGAECERRETVVEHRDVLVAGGQLGGIAGSVVAAAGCTRAAEGRFDPDGRRHR